MKMRFEIIALFFTVHVAYIDQICLPDLRIAASSLFTGKASTEPARAQRVGRKGEEKTEQHV